MVNAPPCAVCGFTLRWLSQQNSWGCDRCQRMFPASGAGAPQQQAAPAAQQPSPWAPPGQQGFAPPQQQGFGQQRPPQPPPQQPPPQQPPNPYAQQGYGAPPQQPNPYAPQGQPQQPPYGQPPQQPYGAHPQGAATPAPAMAGPPGKKSGKGLVIGLALAAVAIAGGVIAFVMLRGGGGAAAGGSRTEVVKGTLAALAAGDVDGLIKLSDPIGLHAKVVDCEGKTERIKGEDDPDDDKELSEKDKEDRDPKKQLEKQKKEYGEIAPKTKGAKIELVEIVTKEPPVPSDDEKKPEDDDKDDRGMLFKKGKRLMRGCVAKVPVRFHSAKLKIKVTPPKEKDAIEQDVEIMMLQVGKGWWLAVPPTISMGIGALSTEMTALKDKICACKDAACAKKIDEEFKDSPRRKSIKKEIKALTKEDRDKLEAIEDEAKKCESKLGGGETLAALESFRDKMCVCSDRACADKVSQEMMVWAKSHMEDSKPDPDTTERAMKVSEEFAKCMTKAMEASSGTGIGATIAGAGTTDDDVDFPPAPQLPAACEDYRKALATIAKCPKYPASGRQSLVDGWKVLKNMTNLPASAKASIADTCANGAKSLQDLMPQLGC